MATAKKRASKGAAQKRASASKSKVHRPNNEPPKTLPFTMEEQSLIEVLDQAEVLSKQLGDAEVHALVIATYEAVKSAIFGRCTVDQTLWVAKQEDEPLLALDADGRGLLKAARPWLNKITNPKPGQPGLGMTWTQRQLVDMLGSVARLADDDLLFYGLAAVPEAERTGSTVDWLCKYAWLKVDARVIAAAAWPDLVANRHLVGVASAPTKDDFVESASRAIEHQRRAKGSQQVEFVDLSGFAAILLRSFGVERTRSNDLTKRAKKLNG